MKRFLKYLIPISFLILIIGAIAGYLLFFKNGLSVESKGLWGVSFQDSYMFGIPENYIADFISAPGTAIVISETVETYNPRNYQDLLEKEAIIIQSFPSLNKNDDLFEKYVNQAYQSTEDLKAEISFEKIEKNKVASVVIRDQNGKIVEFIKIVNLSKPVIIATSGPSETLSGILKSIKNIDQQDKDLEEIKNQIVLFGTLIKSSLSGEVYSLFSEERKEKTSQSDLNIILEGSQKIIKRNISLYGGTFDTEKNSFSCRLLFVDPADTSDHRMGSLTLVKEDNDWLISELNLPKDVVENMDTEGGSDDIQEEINKALEANQ